MSAVPVSRGFRLPDAHLGRGRVRDPVSYSPLSASQVRSRLAARLNAPTRRVFGIGQVSLPSRQIARANLIGPSGRVLLTLEVDRLSGRILRYD